MILGAVSAADLTDVSITEDSNLGDDVYTLSAQNKLEVSSEDSISENIVNSHDDLKDYPADDSDYGDNGKINASGDVDDDILSVSDDYEAVCASESDSDVISASLNDSDNLAAAAKTSTTLSVSDTHYAKSATQFKVTLKDANGKAIANQKISFKVNGKTYTGSTDKNGVASIKTAALAIGTYKATVSYSGSSKYSSSSLSKKVKVLSSVKGSDMTKYDGYVAIYTATFWKDTGVLAKAKVYFKVNGVSYLRSTNTKGVSTLKVNLAHGTYDIVSINPYSGEKVSNKLVVKKDTTVLTHGSTDTYVSPNKKFTFTVTLKTKHNALIGNQNIKFTYNNKQVTAKTNENGKASITIPALSKGTYKITYKFDGNKRFPAASETGYIHVTSSQVKFTSKALKMSYKDGSKFSVKVTKNGKALAKKNVKFTLDGKTSTVKTDSNGNAKLAVGSLKPGDYKVSYAYSTKGSSDYATGSNKITVSKATVTLVAGNLNMKYQDGSSYKVVVKNSAGKVLKNVKVKINIKGKDYIRTTNSKGVAKQDIGLLIGTYTVKSTVYNNYYKSSTVTKKITVTGTKFVADDDVYYSEGSKVSFSVKLLNEKNKPIKNKKITFTCNGKTYTKNSDAKGVAKVNLGTLSKGDYKIKFSDGSYSDSSKLHVVNKVAISQIISSSRTVKSYIEKNHKLPSTVKINGVSYSTAQYLYLASKAIVQLKAGNRAPIPVIDVKNPTNPGSAANKGNLNDYLSVAKSVVKTAESKGIMPNSVSSKVGSIGYKGLVYAFARVDAFYGDNDRMPAFVSIESLSSSSSASGLNSKNTIENLAAYLAASANCQVNNTKIKELVTKLTKGLTSDKAKANAIFSYVRDTVSYSFYYNTKYGAVGTLNSKTGNCVDHSHLLVAMYRTAGLASRYVHGTCTFSGGGTYGHVWAQVLVDNTWTVSDATSSRNSLGSVANWNTHSYKLHSYSASLSF